MDKMDQVNLYILGGGPTGLMLLYQILVDTTKIHIQPDNKLLETKLCIKLYEKRKGYSRNQVLFIKKELALYKNNDLSNCSKTIENLDVFPKSRFGDSQQNPVGSTIKINEFEKCMEEYILKNISENTKKDMEKILEELKSDKGVTIERTQENEILFKSINIQFKEEKVSEEELIKIRDEKQEGVVNIVFNCLGVPSEYNKYVREIFGSCVELEPFVFFQRDEALNAFYKYGLVTCVETQQIPKIITREIPQDKVRFFKIEDNKYYFGMQLSDINSDIEQLIKYELKHYGITDYELTNLDNLGSIEGHFRDKLTQPKITKEKYTVFEYPLETHCLKNPVIYPTKTQHAYYLPVGEAAVISHFFPEVVLKILYPKLKILEDIYTI